MTLLETLEQSRNILGNEFFLLLLFLVVSISFFVALEYFVFCSIIFD